MNKKKCFYFGQRVIVGNKEIGTVARPTAEQGYTEVRQHNSGHWIRMGEDKTATLYEDSMVEPLPNGQLQEH